ncbi:MAG: hypothetical protein ACTSV5_09045 [Promethearchaeota archaeon]
MTKENNTEELTTQKIYEELNDKIVLFSSILEKFGLDLITKLGQTNLKLNKLTEKVNELYNTTLDIKSLKPQLNTVIKSQKQLKKEIELMQNLITNIKTPIISNYKESNEIKRDETTTETKLNIIKQFNSLKQEISTSEDPKSIIKSLEIIKEQIFEFTGGHRILYEISQIINRLNTLESLSEIFDNDNTNSPSLKEYLSEKITFWINKLDLKH